MMNRAFATTLLFLCVLQLGDAWTTHAALTQNLAEEANPLAASLMQIFGVVPVLLTGKLVALGFLVALWRARGLLVRHPSLLYSTVVLACYYSWVVAQNALFVLAAA